MKKLITCAIAAAGIMGLAASATAADNNSSATRFYVTPMLTTSFTINPNTFNRDENINGLQLSFGKNFGDYLALELYAFHFNDTQIDDKYDSESNVDVTGYGASALFFPVRDLLPVFALIGGGIGTFDFDAVNDALPNNSTDIKVNKQDSVFYDLGAGLMIPVNDYGVAVRAEYRYRNADVDITSDQSLEFQDHIFSIGLQVPIGAPAAPKAKPEATPAPVQPVDSDGDGVGDPDDWCPGTPAGVQVDSTGCAGDSDGDGVSDAKDQCPGTAQGVKVDAQGCEVEKKSSVVLKGVTFEYDSSTLTTQAESRLDNVIAAVKASPDIKFRIEGYTDSIASEEYNQKLSERRARSVKQYLTGHGISTNRITQVVGYGEAQPVATNETRAGRAQNRRVELEIVNQ